MLLLLIARLFSSQIMFSFRFNFTSLCTYIWNYNINIKKEKNTYITIKGDNGILFVNGG